MVRLAIDDTEIHAPAGATILEAADASGLYIPRLCSHPELPAIDPEKLAASPEVFLGGVPRRHHPSPDNGRWQVCQLCLVKLQSQGEPVRSCATVAEDGMRVATSSTEIESRRREKMRKIFSTHPHACVQCAQKAGCALEPCSTNVAKEERCCPIFHSCELRKVAEFVGIPDDTPRYLPAGLPVVEDEPLLLMDTNLCIGCLRCVRMCGEIRQVHALGFVLDSDGEPVVGTTAPTLAESACRFCMSCIEVCPTGALRLKIEEVRLDGQRVAPCLAACPAGMDVPRYLREIRRGELARAEAVIREAAPLPRVLGQICFHPCEARCLRGEVSEPMAICGLKRAATDHANEAVWRAGLETFSPTGKRIAVIGAGPAGLTAAWFLRHKGHRVTLYDSQPSPGGWLRDGIPRYRLAAAALEADVDEILGLGIETALGVEVGKDVTFGEISRIHDAVLLAAGARRGKGLSCEGAELVGVESGLELLQRLTANGDQVGRLFAGEKVVVIGGGNVAIDVARSTVRVGADEVHLFCLEEREEMPAHVWEIVAAEQEGIVVHPGWGPARITGQSRAEGVVFHKCLSVFDDHGRFAPRFDNTTTLSHDADRLLVAIGQVPVLGFLEGVEGLELDDSDYLRVDSESMETSVEGVFAAGEVVSGPASAIEAIAQARRAASGIDRYLGGNGDLSFSLLDATEPEVELGRIGGFADLPRIPMPRLPLSEATASFALVAQGYPSPEALREADRCLRCDLRLLLKPAPTPPEPWLELTPENVAAVPASEGVYQLLDDDKTIYAIQGVRDLRSALSEILVSSSKARYFLFAEDPMYSKRESELIQQYLQEHGCMPPGEGEDDLDDLF